MWRKWEREVEATSEKRGEGMKSEDAKVEISAWRVSASSDCRHWLAVEDEHFLFEAVKPGDAVLLMDETGDLAWGVRRVFLVRRVSEGCIVYFDRECDFEMPQPVAFAGAGDKRTLRRIDLDVVNDVLQREHPPHPGNEEAPDEDDCIGWDFSTVCDMVPVDNDESRVYVRKLLETIVTDDLLGPAQGPEEEIVGMSVRDRYILGRLGPRRVDGAGSAAPTDEKIQEADESPDENKNGNEDHAEHDEAKTPGTDTAEEEVTHSRLMELCTDHQADISMALRNLVQAEILYSEGYGRGTVYHILQSNKSAIETNNGMGSSSVTRGPSSDIEGPSSDIEGPSSGLGGLSPEILNRGRRECLLLLLRGSDMSAATLRLQLKRNNATKFRRNILIPLIKAGFVIPTMKPLQHPRQKYRITDVGRQYMVREGQPSLAQ